MDFNISDELKMLQKLVRDFAIKEILPIVAEDERNQRFQREIVKKMGELGFLGCPIPLAYGGSDMGYLAHAICTEEIARVSGSLRGAFNMQTMGTALGIYKFGNEDQKKEYIPKLVSGELLGCVGITEPEAGTDTAAMKSTAVREGDFYILNGQKTWITWGSVADIGICYTYTDRSKKHRGISAFVLDMHSRGVTKADIKYKMGWHASPTSEIFFDNVKIPRENLLGNEGEGFVYMMESLDNTRLTAAAGAVGVCQAFVDEAVKYAQERVQFGQPIANFQLIQEQIGRMVVETEAARLLVNRCAVQKDEGKRNTLETYIAKYYSCDVASRMADEALRILGAYGYSGEYPVERHLRDAKVYQILEGSANILKTLIGMDALGLRKANR
jgi:glutaryl-CoA dehydrogenase (non-decarboxylating)